MDDLEHALGLGEPPQLVGPEIEEGHPVGQAVGQEVTGGLGHQRLPAVREPAEPGASTERNAGVPPIRQHDDIAGMQGESHPQVVAVRPRLRVDGELQVDREGQGRPRTVEHGHEAVAFALLRRPHPAVAHHDVTHEDSEALDRSGRSRRIIGPQRRRSLDVAQHQRRRAS